MIIINKDKALTIRIGDNRKIVMPNEKFDYPGDFFAVHPEYKRQIDVEEEAVTEQPSAPSVNPEKGEVDDKKTDAVTDDENKEKKAKRKNKSH